MVGRNRSGEWLFWFSLIAAAAVHAQLAYLAFAYTPEKHGAIARQTTAISISLEASDILEAAEQSDAAQQAAAGIPAEAGEELPDTPETVEQPEPVAEDAEPETEVTEAQPEPAPSPVTDELETAEAQPEAQPEPVTKAEAEATPVTESIPEERPRDRTLEQAEAALERAMQAEMKRREEAERQARVERAARERREERAREQKQAEQREKQRTARGSPSGAGGSANSRSSNGRVSASTGSILNYKSLIQSRIARKRPATAYTGNVVIVLSLTTSGTLKSARVTRSSGNSTLDRQALSAVRRAAPFPPAPAGVSAGSLNNIQVPFTFQR